MDNNQTPIPAPETPPTAGGPWKKFRPRYLLPALMGLVLALALIVHLVNILFVPAKPTPQQVAQQKAAQQYAQTTPANPSDVDGFTKQTARSANDLRQQAVTAKGLGNLTPQQGQPGLPNPLAVPGSPGNTDPVVYKAWADADAAARQGAPGIPGSSTGPYGQNSAPGAASASTAEEKREAARKRQQERLRASSIAFDFTKADHPERSQTSQTGPTSSGPPNPLAVPGDPGNTDPVVYKAWADADAGGRQGTPVIPANLQQAKLQQQPPQTSAGGAGAHGKDQSEPHTLKLHTCTDLCEGDLIETVLTNRINGEYPGFIDAMVTQPVYSHDWDARGRRLLIPIGSRVLGNVTAVNSTTAQRLFVAFHKLRRPDGSTFSLDNFTGLDMQGEAGLRDLVNHHLFSIFGASLAIAAVGGVAQIGNNQTGFGYDPSVAIRNSASSQLGEESMQILNHFLNQPPTMVVREGKNLVKVYISQDLTLAPYEPKERNYVSQAQGANGAGNP